MIETGLMNTSSRPYFTERPFCCVPVCAVFGWMGFSRIFDFVFLFVFVISNWPVYAAGCGWVGANIPPSSSSVMAVDSNKVAAPEGDWCITNNVQLFI